MNVLFVSRERPGRFGPLARELARVPGWHCEILCGAEGGPLEGVSLIEYPRENAQSDAHFVTRLFDQQVRDAEAIYDAARSSCRRTPDIVVDAAGTGSCLPLSDLFRCPTVAYLEYFHASGNRAPHTRARQNLTEAEQLRLRTANAASLLDLVNCHAGLTSTQFQHSLLPKEFSYKVRVLYEGCDVNLFRRRTSAPRVIGKRTIPDGTRIVTFLAKQLNPSCGFPTFLDASAEIESRFPNVLFVVYGADAPAAPIEGQPAETVRQRFLREKQRDLSKYLFIERLPENDLANLFSITDLVLHLPVPSSPLPEVVAAMACECVVLGSDFAPMREFIRHRQNGLLAGFYSVAAMADEVVRVLKAGGDYRPLGSRARAFVAQYLSMEATVPKFQDLLRQAGDRLPDQFAEEELAIEAEEELEEEESP